MKYLARMFMATLIGIIPAGLITGGFFIPIAKHTRNIIWTGHHASVSGELLTILFVFTLAIASIVASIVVFISAFDHHEKDKYGWSTPKIAHKGWVHQVWDACQWGEKVIKK